MRLKEALEKKLTEEELSNLKTAYDMVGSIAIIEVPDELKSKEKIIAETLMTMQKNIKTVLKKAGQHEGEFRTQKLKFVAGKRTKETEAKENNVRIKLNVEKVYFSTRLSTERKRVSELVQEGESVLVMFSGCAPYVCVIAKNTEAGEVYGVEINPAGHEYGLENLKLNKITNAKLYCGDVREVVPKLKKKFNRILMPLPRSAEDFLDIALGAAKKGATVHFYDFEDEPDIQEKAIKKVEKACKTAKRPYKVLLWRKCGQYSPRKYRLVVDFKVL
ncbi:MAG: class I SAM-dependent methyltransferase family protein [Nanoarchaeota archaeon]|nr:class I SAM-dependent methyltransferase family protein [Nanoarchaeota archaeon]